MHSIKRDDYRGFIGRAFFLDNLALTDWVNSQNLANTFYCLGDGHDGIWKLYSAIALYSESRQEILDWYHLKENLYKIQAKKQFLLQIESFLWQGQVESAIEKLRKSKYVGVTQFTKYLHKHRHRLVNYMYFQAEQLSSIGSGAVESAVKQIDKRMLSCRSTVEVP